MQTGLRSTQYQQYYDFGPSTLDCSARLIHQQQHVDRNERTTFQAPVHIHHHQLHHSHHHHHHDHNHDHHHQQQLIEQPPALNANFDQNNHQPHHHHHNQHQQQPIESHRYLNSDLQQRTNELTTPNGLNESLIVYQDQHQQPNQFQHHINSVENNGNNNDNQSDANQKRQHEDATDLETREPIYHQQGCVSIQQQQRQQQQQQHQQGYQTIYYEAPIFNGNCAIEAQEGGNQTSEQQNQTSFVPNQLLPFINSSQPSDAECVYFQYHQAYVENDETLLPSDHSESEIALSLNEQSQQQQTSFYDQEQISVADKQQTQVYQTLETITNTFDLNSHHQEQQFNHQVDITTLTSNNDEQQQQKFEQQTQQSQQTGLVKPASPYQLHSDLYHHNHNNNHIQFSYIHSESTGASTLTQSRNHSLANTESSHSSAASTTSSSESEESYASTLTRDEKRAREANIPLTYYQIVNLSIDQFNEQLAKHKLSESQLTLIKDIRRRGKNKVAAQSCRKRKMEQIYELQHEVNSLATRKRLLNCECSQLIEDHGNLVQEYNKIYTILQDKMQASQQQNL